MLGALSLIAIAGGGYYLAGSTSGDAIWDSGAIEPEARAAVPAPAVPAVAAAPATPPVDEQADQVRGVVQASQEATLASRMTARIVSMPYKVGTKFGQGAALVQLDCSQLRAELAASRAATAAYKTQYDTNVELDQYQAIGTNEVKISKANLAKAQGESVAIAAQLGDCAIRAPFVGVVVEEIAHRGEVAASGQPLIKLQGGGALEAELIVPSNWLTWIKPGVPFDFTIDETREKISGVVKRLGASVDPVSKTIRITGDIQPGDGTVLPGMSGTAHFQKPVAVVAQVVPPAAPPPAVTPASARAAPSAKMR